MDSDLTNHSSIGSRCSTASPGDQNAFESVLTFEPGGAATRVETRTVFPTRKVRDEVVEKHHAVEGGRRTLG